MACTAARAVVRPSPCSACGQILSTAHPSAALAKPAKGSTTRASPKSRQGRSVTVTQ